MIDRNSQGLYPDFKLTMKRIDGKIILTADYGEDEPRQEFYPDTVEESFEYANKLMAICAFNEYSMF